VVTDYLEGERDAAAVPPERLRALIDRYDEELLYVDHWLGAFLERVLREHPDTLVVLAGDHGEEFLDHGLFGHAHTLYQELLHVPLVLWSPDLPARRVATQVRLLDVLPTVLELAGIADALPPGVQGESLVPVADGRETADRPAPAETGGDERPAWHWRALSDGRLKMIRREADLPTARPLPSLAPWDRSAPRPTWLLFDVLADPAEEHDVYAERRDEAERLFALMRARGWWTAPEALLSLRRRAPDVAPDDLPALRALGYAGEDAP
jgi:arylsulfatase A-like enzyme